jgi:hypothetical protein
MAMMVKRIVMNDSKDNPDNQADHEYRNKHSQNSHAEAPVSHHSKSVKRHHSIIPFPE